MTTDRDRYFTEFGGRTHLHPISEPVFEPGSADKRLRFVAPADPTRAGDIQTLATHEVTRSDIGATGRQRLAGAAVADTAGCGGDTEDVDGAAGGREDLQVGTVIAGRYRLDERLGAGGMGTVYRARDCAIEREVAVKLLRAELINNPRHVRRFRREFRAIARVDHPGCLAVFAEGRHEQQRYIVMEYVPGGNLGRLVGARAEVLLPVLIRLATALECVHSRRIIHRDLKPANVLLAPGNPPVPKLADFGIAKFFGETHTPLTDTGAIMGTIDYLSPEQLAGEALDPRSDLYSLGCVIYKLWADRPPFVGALYQRLRDRLEYKAPPLHTVVPHVPPGLDRLVAHLLQRNPAQRPHRAGDVARELAAIWAQVRGPGDSGGISARVADFGTELATDLTADLTVGLAADLAPDLATADLATADLAPDLAPEPGRGGFLYRPGLIGREASQAALMAQIEEAATAPASKLIAVHGAAGLGKSALLRALGPQLADRGWRAITVAQRSGAQTPFAPFPRVRAVLDKALTAAPSGGQKDDTLRLSPSAQPHPSTTHQRSQLPGDHGVVARRQLARDIAAALLALHKQQAVVLVLEDIHNLEQSALALLLDLCAELDSAKGHRPVLVATMRPRGRAKLEAAAQQGAEVAFLGLPPLDRAAVGHIAAEMLAMADSAVPESLVTHLTAACAGNPLLVQSAVGALVDRGYLRLGASGWHLAADASADALPAALTDAVGDVLRHRLATLSASTRTILAVAALSVQRFDVDLLAEVAGVAEDAVIDAVDEAIRAGLVCSDHSNSDRDEYVFEHERLAAVLREQLDVEDRARYHESMGTALQARQTASPATLAFHFSRGRDGERACHHLRTAGLAAFAAHDYDTAQYYLSQALERVDALAEDSRQQTRIQCIEPLADAWIMVGRISPGIDLLRELTLAVAPPSIYARRLRKLGLALLRTADVAEGLATLERALAVLGDLIPRRRLGLFGRLVRDIVVTVGRRILRRAPVYDQASEERALLHRELAIMYRWSNLERSGAHLVAFVRLAYRLGVNAYLTEAHVGSAFIFSLLAWRKRALRHHEKACQLGHDRGDMRAVAYAEVIRGGTEVLCTYEQEVALAHFAKGLQVAETVGDRFLIDFALSLRGWGNALLGCWQQAGRDFARASAMADELEIPWLRDDAACGRSIAELWQGNVDAAARLARRVQASQTRLALPALEGLTIEILACEAFVAGRFRDAVAYFERARARYRAHHLYRAWGMMTKLLQSEALLCLADEQGQHTVPDLLPLLRRNARRARPLSRLPHYRGCNLLLFGAYESRRGNAAAARRLFAQVRSLRADADPTSYIDTWINARMAFEYLRLGDPREAVAAQLDEIDRVYQTVGLLGMRSWLQRLRAIHRI